MGALGRRVGETLEVTIVPKYLAFHPDSSHVIFIRTRVVSVPRAVYDNIMLYDNNGTVYRT